MHRFVPSGRGSWLQITFRINGLAVGRQTGGDEMPAGAVGKAVVVGKDELLPLLRRAAKAHGLHCQPVDQRVCAPSAR
jgi:hypothetical protein